MNNIIIGLIEFIIMVAYLGLCTFILWRLAIKGKSQPFLYVTAIALGLLFALAAFVVNSFFPSLHQ